MSDEKVTELPKAQKSAKETALNKIWDEKRSKIMGEIKKAVEDYVAADETAKKSFQANEALKDAALQKVNDLQTQLDEFDSLKPKFE